MALDALSPRTQQAVLDQIPAQHKDNLKSAGNRALATAGGVGLYYLGLAVALPVITPIAAFVGLTIGLIAGAKLLGNVSRAISLQQVKSSVKDEKFVPKLKNKAGNALKRSAVLNRISNAAFWGVIGVMVAGSLPVLAPLAAAVSPLVMGAMFASWGASEWNNGTAQATLPMAKLVYDVQGGSYPSAPSSQSAKNSGPKTSAPMTIVNLFKRKASNTNAAPKANKAPAAPTAPKKDAFKP